MSTPEKCLCNGCKSGKRCFASSLICYHDHSQLPGNLNDDSEDFDISISSPLHTEELRKQNESVNDRKWKYKWYSDIESLLAENSSRSSRKGVLKNEANKRHSITSSRFISTPRIKFKPAQHSLKADYKITVIENDISNEFTPSHQTSPEIISGWSPVESEILKTIALNNSNFKGNTKTNSENNSYNEKCNETNNVYKKSYQGNSKPRDVCVNNSVNNNVDKCKEFQKNFLQFKEERKLKDIEKLENSSDESNKCQQNNFKNDRSDSEQVSIDSRESDSPTFSKNNGNILRKFDQIVKDSSEYLAKMSYNEDENSSKLPSNVDFSNPRISTLDISSPTKQSNRNISSSSNSKIHSIRKSSSANLEFQRKIDNKNENSASSSGLDTKENNQYQEISTTSIPRQKTTNACEIISSKSPEAEEHFEIQENATKNYDNESPSQMNKDNDEADDYDNKNYKEEKREGNSELPSSTPFKDYSSTENPLNLLEKNESSNLSECFDETELQSNTKPTKRNFKDSTPVSMYPENPFVSCDEYYADNSSQNLEQGLEYRNYEKKELQTNYGNAKTDKNLEYSKNSKFTLTADKTIAKSSKYQHKNLLEYDLRDMFPDMSILLKTKKRDWDYTNPNLLRALFVQSETKILDPWKEKHMKVRDGGKNQRNNWTNRLRINYLRKKVLKERIDKNMMMYMLQCQRNFAYSEIKPRMTATSQFRRDLSRNQPHVPSSLINYYLLHGRPPFKAVQLKSKCQKVNHVFDCDE